MEDSFLSRISMLPFGVKVCVIEPGFFRTAVTAYEAHWQSNQRIWEKMPQAVRDDYGPDYLQKGKNFKVFLGLIIASGGTTRIGLHACMLKIPLVILTLFISVKPISVSLKKRSVLHHVDLRTPPSIPVRLYWSNTLYLCRQIHRPKKL